MGTSSCGCPPAACRSPTSASWGSWTRGGCGTRGGRRAVARLAAPPGHHPVGRGRPQPRAHGGLRPRGVHVLRVELRPLRGRIQSGVDVLTTHLEEYRMRIALLTPATAVVFAACVAPPPGTLRSGPDPVGTRYINPGTLAALPGFTHAVKVGSTVYVSGEVSLDSTGQLVGPGDLRAQATQAFANLATVLRIAGVTPAEVAKLTIYVVNAKPADLDVIRAAAPDFFPQRNSPAGTIVGVQSLPREGLLIAVD